MATNNISAYVADDDAEDEDDILDTTTNTSSTSTNTNTNTSSKLGKRLENPLGNFASYNYILSLYVITPEAYDQFINFGRTNIGALLAPTGRAPGAYLVAQSGGINNTTSQRAPGFELDYYIDDLKLTASVSGKATGTSSNLTAIAFNIYEPYGFSFLTKLKMTVDALEAHRIAAGLKPIDNQNASKQFFILGIQFQGYDITGKVISGNDVFNGAPIDPRATGAGVFERFYDMNITQVKFKIDNRATVYNITASPISVVSAMGTKRGMIDNGVTIIAYDVDTAISGPEGLLTRLNAEQDRMASSTPPTILEKNNYSVEFLGTEVADIKKASIVSPADKDKSKTPMNSGKTVTASNPSTEQKTSPDNNRRQIAFKNATPIAQAISQIIAQSSYLEDAMKSVYTDDLEPDSETKSNEDLKPNTNKTVKWYNLSVQVSNARWDTKTSDYAFDIKYVIQPYETPVVVSSFVTKGIAYYGPFKRYEYWYTGKNSEILQYEQVLNNAYYTVTLDPDSAGTGSGGAAEIAQAPNKRPNAPRLGRQGEGMDAQNTYITSLIDPESFAKAKITILGDPDFLMTEAPASVSQVYNPHYAADGYTANPNGGQMFIEINFYEPKDYDNTTGTMKINTKILFWKNPEVVQADIDSRGGGISYMVNIVTSHFKGGKFTQDLECVISTFADPDSKSTATGAGRDANNATTAGGAATGSTGLVADATPPTTTGVTSGTPVTAATSTATATPVTGSVTGVANDDAGGDNETASSIDISGREPTP